MPHPLQQVQRQVAVLHRCLSVIPVPQLPPLAPAKLLRHNNSHLNSALLHSTPSRSLYPAAALPLHLSNLSHRADTLRVRDLHPVNPAGTVPPFLKCMAALARGLASDHLHRKSATACLQVLRMVLLLDIIRHARLPRCKGRDNHSNLASPLRIKPGDFKLLFPVIELFTLVNSFIFLFLRVIEVLLSLFIPWLKDF